MRYLRKVRRLRKKQLSREEGLDSSNYKYNISKQKALEKKEAKIRRKHVLLEQKQERAKHKAGIRAHRKSERSKEKHKRHVEKEERRQMRNQSRLAIKSKSREEQELERHRKRQLKEELRSQRQEIKLRLKEKAANDRTLRLQQKKQKKEETLQRKIRLKKLRPYLFRRRMREIVRGMRSFNGATAVRWIKWVIVPGEDKASRNQFLKITVNSTALFVLSYFTLSLIGSYLPFMPHRPLNIKRYYSIIRFTITSTVINGLRMQLKYFTASGPLRASSWAA